MAMATIAFSTAALQLYYRGTIIGEQNLAAGHTVLILTYCITTQCMMLYIMLLALADSSESERETSQMVHKSN